MVGLRENTICDLFATQTCFHHGHGFNLCLADFILLGPTPTHQGNTICVGTPWADEPKLRNVRPSKRPLPLRDQAALREAVWGFVQPLLNQHHQNG